MPIGTRARPCAGFTLIELLVVIAVISIIAAMLFPVFAKVREKARQTACVSNLRQLSLAFDQYTQDYDERLPGAIDVGFGGAGFSGGWIVLRHAFDQGNPSTLTGAFDPAQGSIYPYVKSAAVYVCPDDGTGARTGNSYSVNSCTDVLGPPGVPDSTQPHQGKPLSAFDAPSGFMLLSEEASPDDNNSSTDDGILWLPVNTTTARHTQGSNFSFVDGHVKWYRTSLATQRSLQTGGTGLVVCPQ